MHFRLGHHINLLIQKNRFKLLLLASLMVLVIPAFSGDNFTAELLFFIAMTFLFIQSMVAATDFKSKNKVARYLAVSALIIILWLEPIGLLFNLYDQVKLILLVLFFSFVIGSLLRFIGRSASVNADVIIVVIIIYLLFGIIAGNLSNLFYMYYPNAYHFPESIVKPGFVDFLYFSFITMATVGYGDITPIRSETQTLSYLIAIIGQLYVAIIVAIIVGKYLARNNSNSNSST